MSGQTAISQATGYINRQNITYINGTRNAERDTVRAFTAVELPWGEGGNTFGMNGTNLNRGLRTDKNGYEEVLGGNLNFFC